MRTKDVAGLTEPIILPVLSMDDLCNCRACQSALDYLERSGGVRAAWAECDRLDWIFWYIGQCLGTDPVIALRELFTLAED